MKKSMSGLVIVVLLVAIAVALGAMFIGWLSSMTGKQMDQTKMTTTKMEYCSKIRWDILQTKVIQTTGPDAPPIINLTIANGGNIPFDGFRVRLIGRDGKETVFKDIFFQHGKLTIGAAKDNLIINVSQFVTGAQDNITYSTISSMDYLPIINVTTPMRETLRCTEYMSSKDISQYKE